MDKELNDMMIRFYQLKQCRGMIHGEYSGFHGYKTSRIIDESLRDEESLLWNNILDRIDLNGDK